MPPFFSMIKDLNPSTTLWAMRLRVVRSYDIPAYGNAGQPSSFEIVFHDKENARIHATVNGSAMKNMTTKPVEGHIYALKDFLVVDDKMKFKTTTSPLKIVFLRKTKIAEIFDEIFPVSNFIFKSFKEFELLKATPQFQLFDVIGRLTSCQLSTTQTARGRKMEFTLHDLDESELSCTLWDTYADTLLPFINQTTDDSVIVIIQFGRMTVFRDDINFSNTYNVTKVLVNSDAGEVADFKIQLQKAGIGSTAITTLESGSITALADDFNSGNAVVKKVSEIISCNEPGLYWLPATIVEVEVLADWCYLACKRCSKKLIQENGLFFCGKCLTTERSGNYRYKIQVTVHDESGGARLMLWDKECIELIGKTAAQVKENNEEAFDYVPKEVEDALTNTKALFKVQVREGDCLRTYTSYSVMKMTADAKILSIYNDKYVASKGKEKMSNLQPIEEGSSGIVVPFHDEKQTTDNDDDEITIKRVAKDDGGDLSEGQRKKKTIKKEK